MLFDSCTHPTVNGEWVEGRRGITFQDLAAFRDKNPGYQALAIGLPGVGAYEHEAFKEACDTWGFHAIAAVTTVTKEGLVREFDTIVRLGFRGVKVHPRLLRCNTDYSYLKNVFALCTRHNLVCLLCTYEWATPGNLPSSDPFYQLCDALNHAPNVKLILMHGGGLRLHQFAGLARHSESILLDLSFTLTDYLTAPLLDSLVTSLIANLDRRVCIGGDSPEHSIIEVLSRVKELTRTIDVNKVENVMSKNLSRFFPEVAER
jgi:predicted TIM-barrel fold metal-dependent hydrolase